MGQSLGFVNRFSFHQTDQSCWQSLLISAKSYFIDKLRFFINDRYLNK
jgi:hypothetical protein